MKIHRFNKSQADALLGAVEKGVNSLIGATTENPFFRGQMAHCFPMSVFTLNPLWQVPDLRSR